MVQEALAAVGRPSRQFGEGSGSPPGGSGEVGWPSHRSRRGREAHPAVREGSGVCPYSPGGVGSPSRSSRRGREAIPVFQEALLEVRAGSGGRPGGLQGPPSGQEGSGIPAKVPGLFERPSQWSWGPSWRSGSPPGSLEGFGWGREVVPEFWEGLGGLPSGPGRVGRTSRMSERSRGALPEVQEGSEGPPGCLRGVGRPSRRSGRDREALPEVREGSAGPPSGHGGSPGSHEALPAVCGGFGRPSRRSRRGRESFS